MSDRLAHAVLRLSLYRFERSFILLKVQRMDLLTKRKNSDGQKNEKKQKIPKNQRNLQNTIDKSCFLWYNIHKVESDLIYKVVYDIIS